MNHTKDIFHLLNVTFDANATSTGANNSTSIIYRNAQYPLYVLLPAILGGVALLLLMGYCMHRKQKEEAKREAARRRQPMIRGPEDFITLFAGPPVTHGRNQIHALPPQPPALSVQPASQPPARLLHAAAVVAPLSSGPQPKPARTKRPPRSSTPLSRIEQEPTRSNETSTTRGPHYH